jgi:hypothetical protein
MVEWENESVTGPQMSCVQTEVNGSVKTRKKISAKVSFRPSGGRGSRLASDKSAFAGREAASVSVSSLSRRLQVEVRIGG